MPKVGEVIADKYTIEQLIGVGGMGAVFSAIHKFTGKRVALKWMLPELARDEDAVQRFMREAHAAGRINHPNVVDVYDVGQHAESFFLVMEYLHGEPLTSALARRDMTPSEELELLLPAMRGVAAAHRQGVVHRDLKPDNIFLAYEEDGVRRQPKVLDFGISKLSGDGTVDMRLTKTGAVVGTPYYMSPEQIRGLSGLDKRADIYSMGVILYEALTGRVPFHADTYGALVLEIATGTPQKPSDLVPGLPAGLSAIVLRAMAREADQRYPDMESLVRALEPFAMPQAMRVERRESTGSGLRLESRNTPPRSHSGSLAVSQPRVTSTPFAAEMPQSARSLGWLTGPLLFVVAAIAVVAGVWYFTREPASAPTQAAMPPTTVDPKPVPPPTAASVAPATVAAPTVPSVALPLPTAAANPQLPATAAPNPPPSAANSAATPAIPSNPASGSNPEATRAKPNARKRTVRTASAKPEPDEPAPAPPPTRARTPRSGTLNVDEF